MLLKRPTEDWSCKFALTHSSALMWYISYQPCITSIEWNASSLPIKMSVYLSNWYQDYVANMSLVWMRRRDDSPTDSLGCCVQWRHHLVRAWVPPPLGRTLFPRGQGVRRGWTAGMHWVPTLVDGRPFPWCRSVVVYSAWETPVALRGYPSLRRGLEVPAGAMWARDAVLSAGQGGRFACEQKKNSGTLRQNGRGRSLTRELLTPWSQFA